MIVLSSITSWCRPRWGPNEANHEGWELSSCRTLVHQCINLQLKKLLVYLRFGLVFWMLAASPITAHTGVGDWARHLEELCERSCHVCHVCTFLDTAFYPSAARPGFLGNLGTLKRESFLSRNIPLLILCRRFPLMYNDVLSYTAYNPWFGAWGGTRKKRWCFSSAPKH